MKRSAQVAAERDPRGSAATGVTFLNCDVPEAVRIGLDAADGKNLEVFSASIGRQLLERGLIDEIDLHIAPCCSATGSGCSTTPGHTRPARAAQRR